MSAHRAVALPDGGAEDYDLLAPAVWNPVSNAVVAAADILVGERVLDVFAGTGSGTVPAAQLAGPDGHVDAVDPSSPLLDLAAAKIEALNLGNVAFHCTEPASWTPDAPYDAILSCYGIFLLDEMDRSTDRLIGQLRPGGRIAISVWDDGALEPLGELLRDSLTHSGEAVPGTPFVVENCARLADPDRLHAWLTARGLTDVSVEQLGLTVPLEPDYAWSLALGSGYHALLPDDPDALQLVRRAFLERLDGSIVLNADSLIAVGTYPAEPV
jgi:ubiquinone/menaquinone biosynthesis C-methylase UbiE